MPSSSAALPLPLAPTPSSPQPRPHPQTPPLPHFHPPQTPPSPNPKPKFPTLRHRLSQLCKDGRPHDARRLFDTVPRPSAVLWNTLIIGFVCNGLPDEALTFYARMRSSSAVQPDFYTYSATLKACAESCQLRTGKAVHCHVLRCLLSPSRIVHNSLLNMYSACLSDPDGEMGGRGGELSRNDMVRKVFDTMPRRNVVAWNTMISWYVKTGGFIEAVKQFKVMVDLGIKPSAISFVNVFPAISRIQDFKSATVLYGKLLKLGSGYADDPFAVSSSVLMFSDLGCVDIARMIFDSCVERNIEVWNTIICGYIQNDCHVEAVDLFLEAMKLEQTVVDDVTLILALTAVSLLQHLDLGQQLHAYVIKSSTALCVSILNAIIAMYSRCNLVHTAFRAFEKMVERDVVSWNTMVSAFVQNGLDDEGLMLVYEMQKHGLMIDSIAVTALLSAASNIRNQEIGKQTYAYLLRHGIQVEGINSYLIDMYANCGLINTASRLFEGISGHDRDMATWNSMIAGYTQNGLIEEAIDTLRLMLGHNLTPNAVTVASILPACNPIGHIAFGKQLHGFSIRHFLDQNVFVSTALIDVYSKTGAFTYAEKVFDEAFERNSVTYTTMILCYGQHGVGKKALSLFHSLHCRGIKPDAVTFVAVLSACSYAGLVDEGLQLFESMESIYKIKPTTVHYSCVADMLGRAGRVLEAYEFVKELGEEGNVVGIWGSLLAACKLHKKFELGKMVANNLLEMETRKHMSGYRVLLSNMYAEEGNWGTVDSLRKAMREKDLRKEPGRSWIEIAGCVNSFVSRDQKHQQVDKIYKTLKELIVEMNQSSYNPCLSSSVADISETEELF